MLCGTVYTTFWFKAPESRAPLRRGEWGPWRKGGLGCTLNSAHRLLQQASLGPGALCSCGGCGGCWAQPGSLEGRGEEEEAAAPAESWVCSAVAQGPGRAGSTELSGNSNPHLVPERRLWSVSGWCPWPVPLSTRGATSRAKSAAPDWPQGARGWQTPDREAVRK